jgi:lambda repressor-like predicted transcriptional regulator
MTVACAKQTLRQTFLTSYYTGERRTTFAKAHGIKIEVLWRTRWGTHWELKEHINSLKGTHWELKGTY